MSLTGIVKADYELIQYSVIATTAEELFDQFKTQSPSASVGQTTSERLLRRTLKQTRIINPLQQNGYEEQICEVEMIEFSQHITIHMPRWLNKESATFCLQDNYDQLWDQVLAHEVRHYEIYRALDTAVERQLMNIAPQKSCDLLNTLIDQRYNNMVEINEKLQDEFHRVAPRLELKACR